ncbi:hypothetical protein U3A58_14580 [Algoriphagus sp. C2-6-M1]|uniref:hypothetical protein n=1 Tax=Algoriphagus persicinus TaxID=3108754 RepID=UPI002B3D439E|nr:hypothetical protein [Algoriphagus sp. C2-6-M1]MEB2781620.1 hypothetical protein [Algoriphagus sp. C2-6-M1]
MRRSTFLITFMMISTFAFSQNVTGPKAKNAKLSQKTSRSIAVVYQQTPLTPKGPAAKNAKVWNEAERRIYKMVSFRENVNNPKGLKAKNSKVWEDPELVVSGSKASYVIPKSMRPKKFWWH